MTEEEYDPALLVEEPVSNKTDVTLATRYDTEYIPSDTDHPKITADGVTVTKAQADTILEESLQFGPNFVFVVPASDDDA